ncbi:hypothetical protein K9M79_06435 [Candidatus Woesearchaeota archaeon]|nr:hypothetical protein [Candidatus Woesearchaeota archaeon]
MTNADYDKLKTKYGLPELTELDFLFSLTDIEETNYPLRDICKKIQERYLEMRDSLSEVLSPDSHSASMYECNYLSDTDKSIAFSIFRKMMVIIRTIDLIIMDNNPQSHASTINYALKVWTENKSDLAKIYARLVESWKTELSPEERENYMG